MTRSNRKRRDYEHVYSARHVDGGVASDKDIRYSDPDITLKSVNMF